MCRGSPTLLLLLPLCALVLYCINPDVLMQNYDLRFVLFAFLWCGLVALFGYLSTRPRAVLLLDYACFLPDADRKCGLEVCEYFVRRTGRYSAASEDFMSSIYCKSGLGGETYAPAFIFRGEMEAGLEAAREEAEEGMTRAVDQLLAKTGVPVSAIDLLVVACGMFAPSPSLASVLLRRYGLPESTAAYNLSGMGCSSGVAAVDLAARVLRGCRRRVRYALVVVTESIGPNWYFGDDRSMLVTNCIFRVGGAAVLLTNDPARRGAARMELVRSLCTHHGADDASYRAAFQEEDEAGTVGVALRKDLIRVAGAGLRAHIRSLAPNVLPWSQLLLYTYQTMAMANWKREEADEDKRADYAAAVPDFRRAFEHMCVHTGGKAVIEAVGRLMRLEEEVTEAARMSLHRFGNTSSSLVLYELAYLDAKGRIKSGDRVWMLAFGTGFKVCSLVWRALRGSAMDAGDNPWKDCIHRYPLKAW
ncbi:3-ketoacyl-CoA synthase 4-like [Curcuma longa]|uniref:3-ketoacyl-CoA synthase 4-like n=1 Tax=Curcuma longa TaxID=136217 RepID=UPI003D9E586E